jgi:hypothetical protein
VDTSLAAWDFVGAIAMIAKLYERNTFVVYEPGAERFRRRAARRGHYVPGERLKIRHAGSRKISEPNLVKKRVLESERRTHPEMSCAFHRTRQLRLLRTVRGAGGWDSLHRS